MVNKSTVKFKHLQKDWKLIKANKQVKTITNDNK